MQQTNSLLVALLMPLLIAGVYWFTRPFPTTITSCQVSLAPLSESQKVNIQLAAHALDGTVIRPGSTFSFNGTVGPRTEYRGYLRAPAYVGYDTNSSRGGGICLVSSAVYQAALKCGFEILERTAHTRTIKTIPPGFDATVWYGQTDLRFKNTSHFPVQLKADFSPEEVKIAFLGAPEKNWQPWQLSREQTQTGPDDVLVKTFRTRGVEMNSVSQDKYELTTTRGARR